MMLHVSTQLECDLASPDTELDNGPRDMQVDATYAVGRLPLLHNGESVWNTGAFLRCKLEDIDGSGP
jgi:hypothetical protein